MRRIVTVAALPLLLGLPIAAAARSGHAPARARPAPISSATAVSRSAVAPAEAVFATAFRAERNPRPVRRAAVARVRGPGDGFHWPVKCPETSPFGMRWGRLHPGIDLGCPVGTPVHAAKAGIVTVAGWNGGYGYLVVVDNGYDVSTAYGHNSNLLVHPGQHVVAGQVLSLSGSTGESTGPHVHFEVRVHGIARDPRPFLP
jgi:murein DD-endopeptidase MepM/ murein hydrolase activator NlpD